ncbi:hypothetical protein EDD16DRAFT_1526008 [Pisolithus croceorrhizus]|nr:hypothetical protein EDD16DRAFT_1526008 [Pisolithus croceorrhizus]KAI6108508.1 hypothetical protein EV401DRAFT_1891864 [Pisolithus croceorrhizus]KAI6156174.1 hypothetical protein EDD17DRAFT_1512644 [Pisolithus thermaeus]
MSSYMQMLRQAQATAVDENCNLLEQTVLNPPTFNNPAPRTIVKWVTTLFQLLLAFLDAVLKEVLAHISNVEAAIPTSGGVPLDVAVPAQTRPTPSATAWPTKSPQCAKCHAQGHSTDGCLTRDPTVMRKRVAGNQQKKEACKLNPPIPVSHPLYPYLAANIRPTPTPQDTAMVADAKELHRRCCQSACNRRKHHTATATPGS